MRKTRRRARPPAVAVIVNDQPLDSAQAAAFRAAEADARSPAFAARARAAARFQALEAALERRSQDRELHERLEETLNLSRSRGEEVELASDADSFIRIRVRSRDGLETLARAGAITAVQFKAGMLYRDLYEATDPERDLRSQMSAQAFLQGGGAGAGGRRPEAWAERRLRLSRLVATVEAKIRTADRNDRAVGALREVAGHARCLSHMASGGGGQNACKRALILALDVVADHFGLVARFT